MLGGLWLLLPTEPRTRFFRGELDASAADTATQTSTKTVLILGRGGSKAQVCRQEGGFDVGN
eukprot:m.202511 g.202511  ORF g.202511 m.202511 type:complete len:62 (-) comp15364_c0_seq2:1766-1951(-)